MTQLSAQNEKNGNGSDTWLYTCHVFFQSVINAEGVEIDYIEGTVIWRLVDHYKDGVQIWSHGMAEEVDIYSTYTGEKFRILSCSNAWDVATMTTARHFNLIGDDGSHYIGSLIIDVSNYPDFIFTWEKLIFPGNDK